MIHRKQITLQNRACSLIWGSRLCVYASGSLLKTIFNWTTSILVSRLHFRQYSGNLTRTVSGYTLILVLLPQIGQGTHLAFVFLSPIEILPSFRRAAALRLCIGLSDSRRNSFVDHWMDSSIASTCASIACRSSSVRFLRHSVVLYSRYPARAPSR